MDTLSSVKMVVVGSKRIGGRLVKEIDQQINMPFATEAMAGLKREIIKSNQINFCYQQRDRQLSKRVAKTTH